MLQAILANARSHRSANSKNAGNDRADEPPFAETASSRDYRLEALDLLLASEHFRSSDRNKRFLKFVVEETVAGRSDRIKAFTVAVDVFGRDSSFDASVDPIVRIAAGHLRRSLQVYYETHGKADPVRIVLPLGTYVPTFRKHETLPRRAVRRFGRLIAPRKHGPQSGAVGVAMALAAAGVALAYLALGNAGPTGPQKPVVAIDSARAHGETAEAFAHLVTQSLWVALSGQEAVRVIAVHPEERLADMLARTRANFGSGTPLYQLLTTFRLDRQSLHVYWHVLDGRSKETYLSSSTTAEFAAGDPDTVSEQIAQTVAASLDELTDLADPESGPAESSSGGTASQRKAAGLAHRKARRADSTACSVHCDSEPTHGAVENPADPAAARPSLHGVRESPLLKVAIP